MECVNQTGMFVNCNESNGKFHWSIDGERKDTTCPHNSLPWHVDALCTVQDYSKCYETKVGCDTIAVCVNSNGRSEITQSGKHFLHSKIHQLQNDKPIVDAKYFEDKTICTRQKTSHLKNAEIVTYVKKGSENTCENVYQDTLNKGKGDDFVQKVYESANHDTYECVVNTKKVPMSNTPQWWDWTRVNNYPCKDNGWSCTDNEMKEYNGGKTCNMNDDCHKNSEFGICDTNSKICSFGPAKGTNCSKHEDCDKLSATQGLCSNGKCTTGHTNMTISYIKPAECDPNDKQYSFSKYQYCGKVTQDDNTYYTGVCSTIPNTEKQACRPFDDVNNTPDAISKDEQDYLGFHRQNFYGKETPPWENLQTCNEFIVSDDGAQICATTTEKVHGKLGTVIASDINAAEEKCAAKFHAPSKALRPF